MDAPEAAPTGVAVTTPADTAAAGAGATEGLATPGAGEVEGGSVGALGVVLVPANAGATLRVGTLELAARGAAEAGFEPAAEDGITAAGGFRVTGGAAGVMEDAAARAEPTGGDVAAEVGPEVPCNAAEVEDVEGMEAGVAT